MIPESIVLMNFSARSETLQRHDGARRR